ncbi:MAG: NfeD family protein [Rhodothermales bacterium]
MKLILSIGLSLVGLVSVLRSIRSKGQKPFVGLVGLALLAVGGVWTLVLVGRGLIEGIFFVAGTFAAVALLGYFMWWFVGRLVRRKATAVVSLTARRSHLGKTGSALTPLRPSGVALVEGERIDVETEGEFIAAGSRVRVVAMDSRRYFVRLAD